MPLNGGDSLNDIYLHGFSAVIGTGKVDEAMQSLEENFKYTG